MSQDRLRRVKIVTTSGISLHFIQKLPSRLRDGPESFFPTAAIFVRIVLIRFRALAFCTYVHIWNARTDVLRDNMFAHLPEGDAIGQRRRGGY